MREDYEAYLKLVHSEPIHVKKEVQVIKPKHMPTVDNKGDIAFNKNKTKNAHPTYRGIVMIDGKKYWVNAWDNAFDYDGEEGIKTRLRFDPYIG